MCEDDTSLPGIPVKLWDVTTVQLPTAEFSAQTKQNKMGPLFHFGLSALCNSVVPDATALLVAYMYL